jgi:ankyrin repeat protein
VGGIFGFSNKKYGLKNVTNFPTDNERTLFAFFDGDNFEGVKDLVEKKLVKNLNIARISKIGYGDIIETPLTIAIDKGRYDIAKLLIDYGADLMLPSKKGERAIDRLIDPLIKMNKKKSMTNNETINAGI